MKRYIGSFFLVLLAISILVVSLLRSARVDCAFSGSVSGVPIETNPSVNIPYNFPYPGVLPDHFLWPIKALKDRLWLSVTVGDDKKAEVLLFLADKRMAAAKALFEKGKAELGFTTLTKAEKYLEAASRQVGDCWKDGDDPKTISYKLSLAALKHREYANYFVTIAPEDARAGIIKSFSYSDDIYIRCRESLNSRGLSAPENPFE